MLRFDGAKHFVAAIAMAACCILFGVWTRPAFAQAYPQASYSPDIPTLEDVVGHATGEQVSSVSEMTSYLEALAVAAPDRMTLVNYAESWQGRDLLYAVIAAPDTLQRLDDIQAQTARLAAGEQLSDEALERLPAVVWLSYGVHGDEVSPPDSAVFVAYHLLAAQDNELVETILANTIVVIDPSQNPDGRDRFVHSFRSALGLEAQADRYTVEHEQPWPRGRFNHYLFDLNRDWFALTQPETRGKIAALLEWNPVVYVDSHEMGGDNTYYFLPPADPLNPNITADQRAKQNQWGRNIARWFDRFGVPYFTREVYDAFYPGYGDMWPTLNGATASTFEQASARGLRFDRMDGRVLTFGEGVRNNVLSSLATLEVVARNKQQFLADYGAYRREAIADGTRADDRYVVLDLAERRYEAHALVRRLAAQGIQVQQVPAGSRQCGATYSAGAFVVDLAQPQGRLVRTLLSRDTPLPPDFVLDQEGRRDRGLNHELYDVTAWSLPLMDGVAAAYCRRVDLSDGLWVAAGSPIPSLTGPAGSYGQIVPWTDGGQARLVIAALQAGLSGKTTDEPFIQNGRIFPAGTAVFPVADNADGLAATLNSLAAEIGAETVAMETSWVEDGPNFGSRSFAQLKLPRVALAWGDGTAASQTGATRFVLERQLGLPVATIRVSSLRRANLADYDVVILPETGFGFDDELGRGASALDEFAAGGGVVIAIGDAVAALADEDIGLLSTQLEYAATDGDGADDEDGARVPGLILETESDYDAYIADHRARPEDIPGVLARTVADTDHWLAAGYDSATALVSGRQIYRPLNAADGTNVFRFVDADSLLQSGYLWEENRSQLAFKPFVMAEPHGGGIVIGFTQSPTTRAYLNGLNLLLANAVILGPARMAN